MTRPKKQKQHDRVASLEKPNSSTKPQRPTDSGTNAAVDIATFCERLIQANTPDLSTAALANLRQQQALATSDRPVVLTVAVKDPTVPLIVRTQVDLARAVKFISAASEVVVDIETSDLDPRKGLIVGIGCATADNTFYIPINHRFDGDGGLRPDQLSLAETMDALQLQSKPMIADNAKFEFRWLRLHAGISCTFVWDTMLAARLLRSDLKAGLKEIAVRELVLKQAYLSPFFCQKL